MKNLKKNDIFAMILCLAAIIPGAAVYSRLPDRIATHWDLNWEVNGTLSKAFVVFGIPLISTLLSMLCCIYVRKMEQKQSAGKLATVICMFIPGLLYFLQGITLLNALGKLGDIRVLICAGASVLMIFLGNYMPKIRRNRFIGIRTRHTLQNDALWHQTHRFTGIIMTSCGVLSLVMSLLGFYTAALVLLPVSVLLPTVYSEILYSRGREKYEKQ